MNNENNIAINVEGVTKSYLNNDVLKGINFQVPQGVSFGCAGVNGAGKSTFLKCLLDFCHYSSGKIDIFGVSTKQRQARQNLSFLPERFVPPYYLNGRNFIKFILRLNRGTFDEQKAQEMFNALDLDLLALDKPVRSFSKGMTQKLGLAAIFLLERKLYILDEPMSGLDPKARALLKRFFRKLHGKGATLFFTSHSLADIEEVCEQMILLHDGQIQFTGTPDQLRAEHGEGKSLEEAFLKLINSDKTDQG